MKGFWIFLLVLGLTYLIVEWGLRYLIRRKLMQFGDIPGLLTKSELKKIIKDAQAKEPWSRLGIPSLMVAVFVAAVAIWLI